MCLSGQVKKALDFHDDLIAKGFQLDKVSYGILIDGLCKAGETRAALQLLRRIEALMVEPDVVMYSTVIHSLCKDKLVSEAFHLYSEMIARIFILMLSLAIIYYMAFVLCVNSKKLFVC
ncbi:pentatricopeptide repeat-containing protein [Trifolium medium]|uniref:Pentatricopeptide repeat-containing protein n=1 Tax=Trifolium medium TaxID=97028 RepID=A0A392N8G6_9FABA|nr:pentatricopeptide repeat-containing protein [Trifolium medium]